MTPRSVDVFTPQPAGRRLKLVAVSPVYAPCTGGGERHLQAIAEELVARGHSVTIVTLNAAKHPDMYTRDGSGLPERETLNGVEIRRVSPSGGRSGRALTWWLRQRGGWRSAHLVLGDGVWGLGRPSALGLFRELLRLEADVLVSANWAYASTYAAHLAARLRGMPVVGLPLFHIACPWAAHPRYRALLAQAATVVTATQAEADFVAARGAPRVDVVGCGIDPSRFASSQPSELRARLGIGGRPVVGFVGRQDIGKGAPTLIAAMRQVWTEIPEAILLMAGPSAHRDKPTRQAIEGLLPEERDRLRLVDDFPDSESASIFSACDLLALPSVEESFGLVFLEAWLCGRPVIGARIPSTECVIDVGRDGMIVNPMDPASLAEAVLQLLRHPEQRKAMGRKDAGRSWRATRATA